MSLGDLEARQKCLDISKSILVRASAGCGKTHETVNRILALLAKGCSDPENILGISFTVDSAQELKTRVIEALNAAANNDACAEHEIEQRKLAAAVLMKDTEKGWNLRVEHDRLRILTFDAFFALLNSQLNDARISDLSVAEDPSELFDEAIDRLLGDGWDDSCEWKESVLWLWEQCDGKELVLRDLLKLMLTKRDQWISHIVNEGEMSSGKAVIKAECLSVLNEGFWKDMGRALGQVVVLDDVDSNIEVFCDDLESLTEADLKEFSKFVLSSSGDFRKRFTTKEGFPKPTKANKEDVNNAKQALNEVLRKHDSKRLKTAVWLLGMTGSTEEESMHFRTSIKVLVAHLAMVFEKHGKCDFSEVALRTLWLLGDEFEPSEVLMRLDHSIDHILIDEAQDVSDTQIAIIEKITSGWEPGDGRTVFIVGDVKQSIYLFRKANPGVFDKLEAEGLNCIEFCGVNLTTNFRSDETVISWVDKTFKRIMPGADLSFNMGFRHTESSCFKKNAETAKVSLESVVAYDKEQYLNREGLVVAELCKEIKAKHPDDSIAILGKNRSGLAGVVNRMEQLNIPFQGLALDALEQSIEVNVIVAMVEISINPENWRAWCVVMRSPLLGVGLSSLEHIWLGENASVYEKIKAWSKEADPQTKEQLGVIFWLIDVCGNERGVEPYRKAWLLMGGAELCKIAGATSKVDSVFGYMFDTFETGVCVKTMKTWLAGRFGDRDSSVPGGVTLMTIHKSKGLEFDHVFIVGGSAGGRGGDSPLIRTEAICNQFGAGVSVANKNLLGVQSDTYTLLGAIEKRRAEHELTRLFYVGATRAKQRLWIGGWEKDGGITIQPRSLLSVLDIEGLNQFTNAVIKSDSSTDTNGSNLGKDIKLVRKALSMQEQSMPIVRENLVNVGDVIAGGDIEDQLFGEAMHRVMQRIVQGGEFTINKEAFHRTCNQELEARGLDAAGCYFRIEKIYGWCVREFESLYGRFKNHLCELRLENRNGSAMIIDYIGLTGSEGLLVDYKFPTKELTDKEVLREYKNKLVKYKECAEDNGILIDKTIIVQPEFSIETEVA